jgi:asparagine synthetase B (glutamine-hydrolysing)
VSKKLRGDFSFAIWDSLKKRLILARDRLGVAPLYYTLTNNSIMFASETKSILECEMVKREFDFEALHYYLTFQYVPSPLTAFKNIKKLPPGHILIWEGNKFTISKYWDITSKTTKYIFKKAMKNHLPESIIKRKRHGFPAPTNHWFSNKEFKQFSENIVLQSDFVCENFKRDKINVLLKNLNETKEAHKFWGGICTGDVV